MILKLLQLIFLVIIVYIVIGFLKLIFHIGRSAGELNKKMEDVKKGNTSSRRAGRGDKVIELDKDQYKVE